MNKLTKENKIPCTYIFYYCNNNNNIIMLNSMLSVNTHQIQKMQRMMQGLHLDFHSSHGLMYVIECILGWNLIILVALAASFHFLCFLFLLFFIFHFISTQSSDSFVYIFYNIKPDLVELALLFCPFSYFLHLILS